MMLLNVILLLYVSLHTSEAEISDATRDMVKEWAPVVYLHSQEKFFPSNLEFYVSQMQMRSSDEIVVSENQDFNTIGNYDNNGKDLHLNTHKDLQDEDEIQDVFYGEKLDAVKHYTMVKEWKDDKNTIDVKYSFFYPYNRGKVVCIGIEIAGTCIGSWESFGNHLSDWERTEIRFQNGKPVKLFLGCHTFGALYAYDESQRLFHFESGKPGPLDYKVQYSPTVKLAVGSNHPEVFSAAGSHGSWGSEGEHIYLEVSAVIHVKLADQCNRGFAWKTWENTHLIDASYSLDHYFKDPEVGWVNFFGKWGNIQKIGCTYESIIGECGLNPGVTGPSFGFYFDSP